MAFLFRVPLRSSGSPCADCFELSVNASSFLSNRIMSLTAKVTFGLCCATSVGVIFYVHWKQNYDRQQLHLGVIRDVERQERRKAQNLYALQQQIALTQHLKQEQEREDWEKQESELHTVPALTAA